MDFQTHGKTGFYLYIYFFVSYENCTKEKGANSFDSFRLKYDVMTPVIEIEIRKY